ncbi:MAG: hypothetical protein QOE68_4722, partial [Thermoanaerobaculia bacterium]|nr:hypothetical protein [Thermoanaerobaculia bacterium]
MSDTSGSGGFGPSTRKIRHQIQIRFGPGSAGATMKFGGAAPQKKPKKRDAAVGTGGAPILQEVLWQPLDDDHMLTDVVLPPEIVYYLKAMSRFIYGAKRGGLAAVVEEFELREESKFPSLRRYISSHAPGNS